MIVFDFFRRIIVFLLGVIVILDGLYGTEESVPKLIIGMVMVGILPISDLPFLHHRDEEHGEKSKSPRRTRDSRRTDVDLEEDVSTS